MSDHICSGPVYQFRSCLRCCARFVIAARPSRGIQEGSLAYLTKYFPHSRSEILETVEKLAKRGDL